MLKQRIITGLILVPLVVSAVLYLPSIWVAALFAVLALLAAWEWASLVCKKSSARFIYVAICGFLLWLSWAMFAEEHTRLLLLIAGCFWAFIVILLAFYQPAWLGEEILHSFLQQSGYLVIVAGWTAITALHKQDPNLLLFFLVLIWFADSVAYFVGKRFGRTKLAEQLSPGKTREGVMGGVFSVFFLSLAGLLLFKLSGLAAVYFVILCVLTALISVVGDLFESLLKRHAGVKDSGSLFPGHGGVLDRIDSILSASPGFVLGLYWLA